MVSKSRTELEEFLQEETDDPYYPDSEWQITSEEQDLPLVKAQIIDPNDHYMHVTWNCPYTGKQICSDIEQTRSGMEIWLCDSMRLAVVEWNDS